MTLKMAQLNTPIMTKIQNADAEIVQFFHSMFINREGRISRSQFIFGFGILVYFFSLSMDLGSAVLQQYYPDNKGIFLFFLLTVALIFQRPFQALYTKRLHDIGQSGWNFFIGMMLYYWSLLFFQNSIELVELVRTNMFFDMEVFKSRINFEKTFVLLAFIYNTFLLLVLFSKKGTSGKNKYGFDPVVKKSSSGKFAMFTKFYK